MNPRPVIVACIITILFVAAAYFGWKWALNPGASTTPSPQRKASLMLSKRERRF